MKRIIGAIVAGVVAFSGIYALAATLNLSTNTLGAKQVAVSGCTDPLVVTYPTADIVASATNASGYELTGVTVTGLTSGATGCESKAAEVTVYNGAASIGSGNLASTGTTGSFSITWTGGSTPDPSLISAVSVVVTG